MLVRFTVRNFATFREKATLDIIASKDKTRAENIIAAGFNTNLLKSVVLYGANASGKSKFFEAFDFMKWFVINSSKESQRGEPIPVTPFLLNTASLAAPTEFEVIFIYKEEMYRYGFEVDSEKVMAEWLYNTSKVKEVEIFYREEQEFKIHERKFTRGRTLVKERLVRNNVLLVAAAAQWNEPITGKVLEWFEQADFIPGSKEPNYENHSIDLINTPSLKSQLTELLKSADMGIEDIRVEDQDTISILKKQSDNEIQRTNRIAQKVITTHRVYDETYQDAGRQEFSLNREESEGTRKYFAILGPILNALNKGQVIFVDELDAKLHPNLVCKIVDIFNSQKLNPHNAQLIINTHDTNLLSTGNFRRDQIWFTEKNRYGEAALYSLADFKTDTVRKDENYEKNYILGKYGAIPFLGNFEDLLGK